MKPEENMHDRQEFQALVTELRRGSLTIAVLGCLKKPHYGYALLQTMQEFDIDIEANTLYPLLRRLEKQELLASDWDTSESRPRKFYTLSTKGEEALQLLIEEMARMQNSFDLILHNNTGRKKSDESSIS